MSALPLSPVDNNYLTSRLVSNQLLQNKMNLTLEDNVTATPIPQVLTDGAGRCYLSGSITIDNGSPAANMDLARLPSILVPNYEAYFPVSVLRSGAHVSNAIKLSASGSSIASVTLTAAGVYASAPTLSATAPGSGASLTPVLKAVSATASSAGSSYAPADTITFTGGTHTANAVATVATTNLVSAAVNTPGTGYAPGDVITLSGGTFTTAAKLNITHTKVISATIAAGGSGGTAGNQTVTGTTGTGTKFQATVTISGGAIISVNSVSVAGNYTVNPTVPSNEPVTGAGLTGAALNVGMGVLTTTVNTAGSYTVNPTLMNQSSTTGSGTGASFNSPSFGVNTVTITTPGSYTVLPSNPVAQGSTSGSGSGAAFTVLWGLLSVTVADGGTGYTSESDFLTSGGGEVTPAAGTLVLDESSVGILTLVNAPNDGDIVNLESIQFVVNSYQGG